MLNGIPTQRLIFVSLTLDSEHYGWHQHLNDGIIVVIKLNEKDCCDRQLTGNFPHLSHVVFQVLPKIRGWFMNDIQIGNDWHNDRIPPQMVRQHKMNEYA